MEAFREICSKNHIQEHEMQGIINISIQNNWCYIENAKVACSSLKYNLMQLEFETSGLRIEKYQNINPSLLHEPMYGPMLHPFQVKNKTLENIFANNKFCIFTFVRNPFSRILSAYLDKIDKNKAPKIHIVRKLYQSEELNLEVSFKDFVRLLYKEKRILYIDKHWRPQSANLMLPVMKYNYIGRLENFDEDFTKVKELISNKSFVDKKIEDYTPHKTSASDKITAYYDLETEEMVAEMYADDFKNFGYNLKL
jgi:hypothetical protein